MSALTNDEYTTVEGKGSCPARASDEGVSSRPPDDDFHLAPTQLVEVMCECGRSDCTGEIMLSLKEYEAVRLHPTRFLLKEGHEVAM
jgi:hypothetical protein